MEGGDKTKDPGKLDAGRFKAFQSECEHSGLKSPSKPPRAQKKALQVHEKLKIFQEAVPLITADAEKHIRFNDDVVSELKQINHPVNVVSVVGKYRTGKSLLLNRLARQNKVFQVGSTHNAMTKGIWIFCLPHPTQESQVLVLLDTEGLDDAMKKNDIEERWYFVLATLLSSTLVYNHMGTFDKGAIKKLKFLENIKTNINVLESEHGNDSFFDVFFPVFVVAVRDNYLESTDENKDPVSADQFLENTLVLQRGPTDSIRKFNQPRILVRKYFKERKCFMFCSPEAPESLDEGDEKQNKDFERDVKSFLNYINGCKPKRMTTGKVLTGRMLGSLVCSYTRFVQEGKTPCLHEAAKEMIDSENKNTVSDAENVYKKVMQELIGSSMPNWETMVRLHEQCMEEAIEYLRCNVIYDDIELFLDTAKDSFIKILNKLKKSIAKDSENICWQTLQSLDNQRIGRKLKEQAYEHVAGYDDYIADIDWIIKQYNRRTGLGPRMQNVLQSYLDGKEREEEAVYQQVLKAQGESARGREEKGNEPIRRSQLIQLSKEEKSKSEPGSGVSDDLLKRIMADQQLQKKDMNENFFTVMKLKIAEYERQLGEGADGSAAITKEENDRFRETFLKGTIEQPIGPPPSPFGAEKPLSPTKPGKCKIF